MQYTIRPVTLHDIPFLWDMLYESLFVPEGGEPFSRDILQDPYISKYVEGWGREGDFGFIAVTPEGEPIGSITARFFSEENQGFGYAGNDTPELGMAILPQYRGRGIGTSLIKHLFEEAKTRNISKLSLSVAPDNEAAMKLYQRFGFKEIGMVGTSLTMVSSVEGKAFQFYSMTEEFASIIAAWTYEEPYSLYSMDGSNESIMEFLNGDYYYALNAQQELAGYICTGNSARVPGGYQAGIYEDDRFIDLGLGLRPEFTGKGHGANFVQTGLQWVCERYNSSRIRLVVAAFNERAIKVYNRAGFTQGKHFLSKVQGQDMEFIVMQCKIPIVRNS